MKTALSLLVVLGGLALPVASLQAQSHPSVPPHGPTAQVMPYPYWYPAPCYYPPIPQAPDVCGGRGYYSVNCYGQPYGPNYCVHPPFAPYNGALPTPVAKSPLVPPIPVLAPPPPCPPCPPPPTPMFTPHAYARSPRDYFMVDEPDYYYPTQLGGEGYGGRYRTGFGGGAGGAGFIGGAAIIGGAGGAGFIGGAGVNVAPPPAPAMGEGKK